MRLETKFDLGDQVCAVFKSYHSDPWTVSGIVQITDCIIEVTEYGQVEWYKCAGINNAFFPDRLFLSKQDAINEANKLNTAEWSEDDATSA